MRAKRATHVLLDQVRIIHEGGDAIIDHAEANVCSARFGSPHRVDERRRDSRSVQRDPRRCERRTPKNDLRLVVAVLLYPPNEKPRAGRDEN